MAATIWKAPSNKDKPYVPLAKQNSGPLWAPPKVPTQLQTEFRTHYGHFREGPKRPGLSFCESRYLSTQSSSRPVTADLALAGRSGSAVAASMRHEVSSRPSYLRHSRLSSNASLCSSARGSEADEDSGAHSLETQLQRPLREVDSQKWLAPLLTQYGFAVGVVLTGCGNNIVKQIATRPLTHYTYILSLADAVAYLPVYGAILLTFLALGIVPGNQITFMWCAPGQRFPYFLLMVAAGFASAAADVVGMICTPYVTGPLHSLLSNCTSVYVALLSILLLRQRYSLLQVAALLFVLAAVIIGILPSFVKQDPTVSNQTNPFFALLLALSCVGNALSFILKEFLFKRYDSWLLEEYGQTSEKGLNIFVLNTHEAIAQLPFTLILVPLNVAFGQTNGQSLFEYLKDATDCVFQSTPDVCGSESSHAEWAGKLTLMYVVFNLCMNVTTLLAVKYGSALGTFVALKAIFPVSMVLFAYVQWPLLGKTDIHWLTWMSVLVLLPSIGVYQWATIQQNKRAAIHPSLASCCWPFGAARAA